MVEVAAEKTGSSSLFPPSLLPSFNRISINFSRINPSQCVNLFYLVSENFHKHLTEWMILCTALFDEERQVLLERFYMVPAGEKRDIWCCTITLERNVLCRKTTYFWSPWDIVRLLLEPIFYFSMKLEVPPWEYLTFSCVKLIIECKSWERSCRKHFKPSHWWRNVS